MDKNKMDEKNELPEEAVVGLISALEDVKHGRYTIISNY